VGQELLRHGERLVAVAGLPHDLDLGLGLEYRAQAAPDKGVIVGDQNADLSDLPHRPKSLPRKLAFSVRSTSSIAPCCSVSSTVSVHPGGVPSTASRYGMVARTIVPRPGSLRTTSCPPTPSARSRMPTMP